MNTNLAEKVDSGALLQQACAEIERRLRSEQPCTAEDLFAASPELASNPDSALELIYTEFVAREQLGQRPDPADWYARFPRWRHDLEQLFQVHRAAGGHNALPGSFSGGLPPTGGPTGAIGGRLGQYELLEEVGRGGMGVVYKARQAGLDRVVALKVILAGEHSGPQERARFLTEAAAAGSLQHPNIVQIHEVGEQDGRPYLALEWVEGDSLAAKLGGAPWPCRDAARHVETLARAMHYAHQKGIIHRDLKPANILLTADGTPKVADFGLALRQAPGHAEANTPAFRTTAGAILGSPSYMAPEQAAGASRAVGLTADVYSLGAILYELLTGRPPFQGSSVLETLEQVRKQDPVPPTRVQPRLPRDLETICLKCLHKEPAKRYGSALELADDLRRFLVGEPIRARPTTAGERAAKWAKRRPAVAMLLTTVVITAAVGLGAFFWSWQQTLGALDQAKKAHDHEHTLREKVEGALAERTVALARQAWALNDLDAARRYLSECPPAHRDRDWHYLQRVCHACLSTFSAADGEVTSAAWGPDGQSLAWTSKKLLHVWDAKRESIHARPHELASESAFLTITADRGQVIMVAHKARIIPTPGREPVAIMVKTWDLTGDRKPNLQYWGSQRWLLAFARGSPQLAFMTSGQLKRVDVLTGKELPTLPLSPNSTVYAAGLSDDGRRLALADRDGQIRVYDLQTGAETAAIRPDPTVTGTELTFSPDGRRIAMVSQLPDAKGWLVGAWDLETRCKVLSIPTRHFMWCVTFSPDGTRLAFGTAERTVFVWDVAAGRELLTFREHTDRINALAFSPDGQRLASASQDGTVKIWDVRPLEDDSVRAAAR